MYVIYRLTKNGLNNNIKSMNSFVFRIKKKSETFDHKKKNINKNY